MQNCIDFVYSGQDSAKNLWGKHRDSMRRPEIDGRQAFCLKRKSRFRENRLTDYRLTVDSYLKILLQQEHRRTQPKYSDATAAMPTPPSGQWFSLLMPLHYSTLPQLPHAARYLVYSAVHNPLILIILFSF